VSWGLIHTTATAKFFFGSLVYCVCSGVEFLTVCVHENVER
jgi:hypothetical protein